MIKGDKMKHTITVIKDLPGAKVGEEYNLIYPFWLGQCIINDEEDIKKLLNDEWIKITEPKEKNLAEQIEGYLEDNDVKSDLIKNVHLGQGSAKIATDLFFKKLQDVFFNILFHSICIAFIKEKNFTV